MVLNSETSECELDETGKERTHGVTSRSIGKWGFEGHGLGARLSFPRKQSLRQHLITKASLGGAILGQQK